MDSSTESRRLLEEANRRLGELIVMRVRYEKLRCQIQQVDAGIVKRERAEHELRCQLEKERGDVERLEGLTLTALYAAIVGSKDERLAKEQEEFAIARAIHEECLANLDALSAERERLAKEQDQLGFSYSELDELIERKRVLLDLVDDPASANLSKLSERESTLIAQRREVEEAISHGQAAQGALVEVLEQLQSAKNWGVCDMIGGGLLSTAMKHSKINQARKRVQVAQATLRRFTNELEDVERRVNVELQIGDFCSLADYFLDNILTDMFVQDKINNAYSAAERAVSQVKAIILGLHVRSRDIDSELAKMEERKRLVIEKA